MPEPNTPNIGLTIPNTGDLVGTWGSGALNPDFVALDGMLGGVATISLGATATTVLSLPLGSLTPAAGPNQSQNSCIYLQGTLTGNQIIQLGMPGRYVFHNRCLPLNFFVQVISAGGGTKVGLPPGRKCTLFHDGVNVDYVDSPDPGTAYDLHGATILPAWMTACTTLPYLIKDGTIYTMAAYPVLGAMLGNTFGGNGISTFGVPDERARSRIGFDPANTLRLTTAVSGVNGNTMGSSGGDQNPQQHTHTASTIVTDSGHSHLWNQITAFLNISGGGGGTGFQGNTTYSSSGTQIPTNTVPTGITVAVNNNNTFTGASANVQPSIVSFLPLIKT